MPIVTIPVRITVPLASFGLALLVSGCAVNTQSGEISRLAGLGYSQVGSDIAEGTARAFIYSGEVGNQVVCERTRTERCGEQQFR